MSERSIVCLMGPTASGKTALAVELVKRFPFDIISVDSAMVYRGMDIGTAKPGPDILQIAPHRLIDIVDPTEPYSAGQFRVDALRAIEAIWANGRIPLLVGGTMMYFRILLQGLATLPRAHPAWRAAFQVRANKEGWEALYAELQRVDSVAAQRIHPNDRQRIQRALEVHAVTGRRISDWQAEETHPLAHASVYPFAIAPGDRQRLHARIAERFQHMLKAGFMEEMQRLYARPDLSPDLPAMRSVGYRQGWAHLAGALSYEQFCEQTVVATRQLAKRQLTWLRSWPAVRWFDSEAPDWVEKVVEGMVALGVD